MNLLYLENSTWEIDFIHNEFLNDIPNLNKEVFTKNTFNLLENRADIINNSFLVINGVCELNDIIRVVIKIKPLVIFYLSDEGGGYSYWTILQNYTKLLLRQYNFTHYNYAKNNIHFPLGYVKNFLNNENSFSIYKKPLSEREFNASFIGTVKSDRLHMSNVFKENMTRTQIIFVHNNWDIPNLPYSPQECFNIYNNSIFVLCGRGNSNLDCFRIYEAIIAGSIPVLVGDSNEINITFNYNNHILPILYFGSWEEAVTECNKLLIDTDKLINKKNELFNWWKDENQKLKELIKKTFT